MADAIRVSQAPVIASHSGAFARCPVPRNVPDDILAQLPKNGGVVMVNFFSGFVVPEPALREKRGPRRAQEDAPGPRRPRPGVRRVVRGAPPARDGRRRRRPHRPHRQGRRDRPRRHRLRLRRHHVHARRPRRRLLLSQADRRTPPARLLGGRRAQDPRRQRPAGVPRGGEGGRTAPGDDRARYRAVSRGAGTDRLSEVTPGTPGGRRPAARSGRAGGAPA